MTDFIDSIICFCLFLALGICLSVLSNIHLPLPTQEYSYQYIKRPNTPKQAKNDINLNYIKEQELAK